MVLIPLKPLSSAKSRLARLSPPLRSSLALAMAADTAAAAAGSPLVSGVWVVCADEAVRSPLEAVGCQVLPDEHEGDLNAALASAAARAGGGHPRAALTADLPALRPEHVTRALRAAALRPRVHVQDAAGTGTTLLAARAGAELAPQFGADSSRHHRAGGAVAFAGAAAALRRDVDTLADLGEAIRLGVGPRTAAVLYSSSGRSAGLHRLPLSVPEVPVAALHGMGA